MNYPVVLFWLVLFGVVAPSIVWFLRRLKLMRSDMDEAERSYERQLRMEAKRLKAEHEKSGAAGPASSGGEPPAQTGRAVVAPAPTPGGAPPQSLASLARQLSAIAAGGREGARAEAVPSDSEAAQPAVGPAMGTPILPSPVAATEQKLDIAGLLAEREESVAVPNLAMRASAVRLTNRKRMLIVPADSPSEWVEAQLLRYDYVCLAGESRSRVIRRFEDFLTDQMFR